MEWKDSLAGNYEWTGVITNREAKEEVARQVVARVREGKVIGVGSGSTVYLALLALAEKIRLEKLHIEVIPASAESRMLCIRLGIPVVSLWEKRPDWTMDGADEADPRLNLIKGRGGAMFKEKLLLCSSAENYILVDRTKLVARLGERFPIPVEVFPGALAYVGEQLQALGASRISLRPARGKDGPVITESGNFILDASFDFIADTLEKDIKKITGVIESGLFMGYPFRLLVAGSSG